MHEFKNKSFLHYLKLGDEVKSIWFAFRLSRGSIVKKVSHHLLAGMGERSGGESPFLLSVESLKRAGRRQNWHAKQSKTVVLGLNFQVLTLTLTCTWTT